VPPRFSHRKSLIKWEGYPLWEATKEPVRNINKDVPHVVEHYWTNRFKILSFTDPQQLSSSHRSSPQLHAQNSSHSQIQDFQQPAADSQGQCQPSNTLVLSKLVKNVGSQDFEHIFPSAFCLLCQCHFEGGFILKGGKECNVWVAVRSSMSCLFILAFCTVGYCPCFTKFVLVFLHAFHFFAPLGIAPG